MLPFGGAFLPLIASGIGKAVDFFTGQKQQESNTALQREFAQNSIQWKVEDAKKAGLHPLYALGANTTSFQPSLVGSNFGDMGQDVSRAVEQISSEGGRAGNKVADALQLENMGLQNDLLRSQIARLNQGGQVAPPMPSPGQTVDVTLPPEANRSIPPIYVDGKLYLPGRPGTSSSETIESAYGDSIQEAYGWNELLKQFRRNPQVLGSPSQILDQFKGGDIDALMRLWNWLNEVKPYDPERRSVQ